MLYLHIPTRRLVLGVALLGTLGACKQDTATTPQPDVQVNATALGSVLTDQAGKTLYVFANDANGQSACTGPCLTVWPVFYKENPSLGTGLNATDFTTLTRADGSKQTAYRGWPLYYYQTDAKAGDVLGENVNQRWFVARPDYSILIGAGQLVGNDGKSYTKELKEGTGNTIYLTDGTGRTLYAFANDRRGKNNYTREDLSNNATWPLFEGSVKSVPSTLRAADFATITVAGRTQVTFRGWPLYYFGSDAGQRGSTKGVSVPRPGVWPIVNADTPQAP